MKIKNLLLAAFLLLFVQLGFAQVGISTYSSWALGVSTSKNSPIGGELKIFANNTFQTLQMELSGMYNFKPGTYHQLSAGVGINLSPFKEHDQMNAFTFPLALEVFPLKDFRRLSLVVEVAPCIAVEGDSWLRHLWGFRYTFGKD